ncbi:MAG TPA: ornithine cyclodeaminase family protein [Rudaea sp.]|nr:ornithine cyclodeaminase family protein [Rudaea sp.]
MASSVEHRIAMPGQSVSQRETLLLSKAYIHEHIPVAAFLPAMREAFLALDRGELQNPSVGHLKGEGGGVHIKAAAGVERFGKIVVKMNANFPGNPARGLPTIQGVVALFDARSGELLALMDSIEITARRTAAVSALAAQHLARAGSDRLGMIGCGMQALYHLEALRGAFALSHVACADVDQRRASEFARQAQSLGLSVEVATTAAECARTADIVVTCTPSTAPILHRADIAPGCFIAAVGTDSPGKNELAPDLMAAALVVPDDLAQALEMGDTHHAVRAGAMTPASVHAELAAIVSGRFAGRTSSDQIFVFDSTGMAIEDLAAADLVFAHASRDEQAFRFALNAKGC